MESNHSAIRAATLAWLVLLAATLLAWALGSSAQLNSSTFKLVKTGVVLTAFLKVWLVGFQFMELRSGPRIMLYAFSAWVLTICLVLTVIIIG